MNDLSDNQTLFAQSEIHADPQPLAVSQDLAPVKKKSRTPMIIGICVVLVVGLTIIGMLFGNTRKNNTAIQPIETATPAPTISARTPLQQKVIDSEPAIIGADPFSNPFTFPPVDAKTRFLEPKK